ncbi:MAG TPA: hybrid sensor histidine kinase/response regulator [bacterium]|nr:hybrid sensor histidine kinase/response regulator [bacterium]
MEQAKMQVTGERLLIVDDELSIRESLKMYFENKGYSVDTASSAFEAIELLKSMDYGLIITDIRMNGLDGIGLIKKMQEFSDTTPVILITAYPEVTSAIEAVRCGVVDYMVKPFDVKNLERMAVDAIGKVKNSEKQRLNLNYSDEKRDFLMRFSHEIRTPLTPILGYSKLLARGEFGRLFDAQAEAADNIYYNGKKLRTLAEDIILFYAVKYEADRIETAKHRIDEIIRLAVDDEAKLIKEFGHTLRVDIFDRADAVVCDMKMIKRAIVHLIDNAVQYSRRNSLIRISTSLYKLQGVDYVKFSVMDNADNIQGRNRRQLFRRFYDYEGLAPDKWLKDTGGLGLGLSLAKAIIEAHNGRIWLEEQENTPCSGNVFSFILPYST